MKLALPNQYDFLGRFYRLSLTNILSGIMVPLAGLVATAFLGHLPDIRHLAGVILGAILFNYLYRVLSFLRSSTNAMTATAAGQDDQQAILLATMRNGLIALVLGALILILQYPVQKLGFALLSATPEVEASGVAYFNARIWGAPAVLLNFVLMGWFLGREMNGLVLLMSVVGNVANIALDYLFIVRWGWESAGAGTSTAISQYLMLLVGLIGVCLNIQWQELPAVTQKILDKTALKATFSLNGNILVSTLVSVSTFAIFTNLSSAMGTTRLAENGLLLEVVFLSLFINTGSGFATQTLVANFKGQGANEQIVPLVGIATFTNLLFAIALAFVSILFPETVFGLFTDHAELIEQMTPYVNWLIPVMGLAAIYSILNGYFLGLKEAQVLRNSALIAIGVGFAPIAFAAWYFHNNHILWLALASFMATSIAVLGLTAVLNSLPNVPKTVFEASKSDNFAP